jgi:hypothetical protein
VENIFDIEFEIAVLARIGGLVVVKNVGTFSGKNLGEKRVVTLFFFGRRIFLLFLNLNSFA